ncbi:MAG: BrnA antitoxin family protein [Caulobacteraceae bacterium]|nr:BrnA antitoxin family protein [Caulobacteraceae bacterium]
MSADPEDDVPPLTAEDFARARPARAVFSDEALSQFRPRRGRPSVEERKVQVSIRIEPKILAAFKATGTGWQTRINDVLRAAADELPKVARRS